MRLVSSQLWLRPSIFVSTYFFPKALESGSYLYSSVQNWAATFGCPDNNIFKTEVVLIPVNLPNEHWFLLAAFMRERRLQYYDSLNKDGVIYSRVFLQYLSDEVVHIIAAPVHMRLNLTLIPTEIFYFPSVGQEICRGPFDSTFA
jgi:Ulp1 family protease